MARRLAVRLATIATLCAAAPVAAGRIPVQGFDLSRGLAGDKVWDLELDAGGALWAATSTGVSRFDGVRFRNFDARHGLPHSNVLRLLRLADGRLAAGTGAGVALIDPLAAVGDRPWRVLPADVERDGGQLVELAEDGAGALWAGGNRGLFRVEGPPGGERLVAQRAPAGALAVRNLTFDRDGGLWVSFEQGLYRRAAAGSWTGPWRLPAALDDVAGITDLWVDARRTFWVASRAALCAFAPDLDRAGAGELALEAPAAVALAAARPPERPGDGVCVDLAGGLPATRARRLIEPAPDGRLFVLGTEGLVEVGPGGFVVRLTREEARGASPQSALETPDGTLWVGTAEQGLLRLPRSGVELIGPPGALPGAVSTLLPRGSGLTVVLDYLDSRRRLLELDGERLADVTPPGAGELAASWGWGAISLLAPDGAWWVGRSGGVARFPRRPEGGFAPAQPPPPALASALEGAEPIRLFLAADGALWVACHEPVALHRAELATGRVNTFAEIAELPGGAPTAFAESGDGDLWVGFFNGGLARRRGAGRFEPVADAGAGVRGFVYALRFDRRGQLWVAAGGGLVVCRTPSAATPGCERAAPASELDHLQIFGVAEDGLGRIAAATARGLYLIDPASGRIDTLTTAEGLPGNNLAALETAPDGALWIAVDRGLARFRPPPPEGEPAPARIVAVDVAGRPWPVPLGGAASLPRLDLTAGERIVEIEVASLYLGSGPPPAYQWRLGGGPWSVPSVERRLRLAGLAAGDLTIEARAISAAGRTGAATARVELRVLPPLWRRGWFVALAAALAAAALALAYRARVSRLLALERMRTRIAADLHDDLGSSLSRISILAEVARRQAGGGPQADATLQTIGESARELAEMASDIVWAIDPQRDDLASWVARLRRFGEDLFTPLGVAFEMRVPDDAAAIHLPASARRDLYLLAREALNNAAKYAGARTVRVAATRRSGRLAIEIEDDGRGFDARAAAAATARGGGHGLRTMRERALRLGGELVVDSRVAGGTRIALSIPL